MKKFFIITLVALFLTSISSLRANAQSEKPIFLGSSFNYSPEYESSALQINALFEIYNRISIAPNFVHYFSDPPESIQSATGLNLNAHYDLTEGSNFIPYALGGVHVSKTNFDNSNVTGTDYAINTGLGAKYSMNNVLIFSQAKYMIQSWNQFVFGIGFMYQIR